MDNEPAPLSDEIPEIICRVDATVLAEYQELKREAEKKRKDVINTARREVGKLLRWKVPPQERIDQMEEEAHQKLFQIAEEFQQSVQGLVEGLLKKPE